MYLNYLDESQQRVFLQSAVAMIRADKTIRDVEQQMIDRIRAESQFSLAEPARLPSIDKLVAKAAETYRQPAQRNVFLLELAGVCVIDGEEHDAELDVLAKFATALGVEDDQVEEFLGVAREARRLIG